MRTRLGVWFEAARWPNGPVCPHCGSLKHYATKKAGRYRCGEKECRKDFTVMTKSVMERSHAKLTQWAAAFHLYAAIQEGLLRAPAPRAPWLRIQHRMVPASSRHGSDAPWRPRRPRWAAGGKLSRLTRRISASRRTRAVDAAQGPPVHQERQSGPAGKRAIVSLVERGGQRPLIPCPDRRRGDGRQDRARERRIARAVCIPTKASSTSASARIRSARNGQASRASEYAAAT